MKKTIILIVFLFVVINAAFLFTYSPPYTFDRVFFSQGFDNLGICHDHHYLLGVDRNKNRVLVIDIESGRVVASLGKGDGHEDNGLDLNKPYGVVCDEHENRILISDTGNQQIHVVKLSDFSHLQTIKTTALYATIALDPIHQYLFTLIVDSDMLPPSSKIQILNASTFDTVGKPLEINSPEGDWHDRKMYAYDLAIDTKEGKLLVSDIGNARYDIFDINKPHNGAGMRGVSSGFYETGLRSLVPNEVRGVAVDNTTGFVFIADDPKSSRIQILGPKTHETIKNRHVVAPEKLITNDNMLFVVDKDPDTNQMVVNLFVRNKMK